MIAEVAHLIARDAAPERLRALIRSTISDIENSFTTIDRLQSRTRLALALSLLDRGGQTPRFGRPTASLRAELNRLDVDDRHYWISTFYTLLMSAAVRREKATYFTPPAIVRHLIDQAERPDSGAADHRLTTASLRSATEQVDGLRLQFRIPGMC